MRWHIGIRDLSFVVQNGQLDFFAKLVVKKDLEELGRILLCGQLAQQSILSFGITII